MIHLSDVDAVALIPAKGLVHACNSRSAQIDQIALH
jgi:hypothetical protein